jgi:hypothetical protein
MTMLLHIADRVLTRPIMILPDKLTLIASILDRRIGIVGSSFGDIEAEHLKAVPDASRFVGQFEPNDPGNPAAGKKPYRTTPEGVAVTALSVACEPRRLDRRLFRYDVL